MIEYWLTYNSGVEKLRLPVPPQEYEVVTGMNHTKVNVHELGEVLLMGKPKLTTISLTSYFPIRYDGLCQYKDIPWPQACINKIDRWKKSGKPIRLIITGDGLKVNLPCVIEDFNYKQIAGPQDIHFTLELVEYRFIKAKPTTAAKSTANKTTTTSTKRTTTKSSSSTYTIKKGDTLSGISKKVYGDASRWKEIKTKNSIKDEKKIRVGQVLKV